MNLNRFKGIVPTPILIAKYNRNTRGFIAITIAAWNVWGEAQNMWENCFNNSPVEISQQAYKNQQTQDWVALMSKPIALSLKKID